MEIGINDAQGIPGDIIGTNCLVHGGDAACKQIPAHEQGE
jgi:hypothetical protein